MTTPTARPDLARETAEPFAALNQLAESCEAEALASGLPATLLELVRLRASQLNGCGFCLSMHTKRFREHGGPEQQLEQLAEWRDSPLFTESFRAALQLAESVTSLPGGRVPNEDVRVAAEHFDSAQIAHLIWAASLINTFNRLAISTTDGPPE